MGFLLPNKIQQYSTSYTVTPNIAKIELVKTENRGHGK
jgi:hypothetical protein